MSLLLATALALGAVLLLRPPHGSPARLRRAAGQRHTLQARTAGAGIVSMALRWSGRAGKRGAPQGAAMTLVVQQLAALLKGGRTPGRLWDELWVLYGAAAQAGQEWPVPARFPALPSLQPPPVTTSLKPLRGIDASGLSSGSVTVLAAARSAAASGAPVSEAIRKALQPALSAHHREARIWSELAACLDIAEASGCPLADVLTRFAAQLEVEDDADAARQTALAGPKATVTLLSWLPIMGLGLGAALGVDPVAVLLGTPLGLAALAAGVALTAAGRVWSARLVAAAAGAGAP